MVTSRVISVGAILWLLTASPGVVAQDARSEQLKQRGTASVDLSQHFDGWFLSMERGALDSAYICGDLGLGGRWSFVGCGSGSGFLYRPRPGESDLAHFRTQYAAPIFLASPTRLEISPGFGFVEVQKGPDESGLKFAPGRGPEVREASGPEAALELRFESPVETGPFSSLRAKWDAGVAWIPDAPAVAGSSEVVTFSTFSVNGRF